MENLLSKQDEIHQQLNRQFSNYKKSPKDRLTKFYIEAKAENVESLWKQFSNNHYELIALVKGSEKAKIPYFSVDMYDAAEEIYILYKAKLSEDLEVRLTQQPVPATIKSSCSSSGIEAKLPRIQLPTFSGTYQEWQTFFDMFMSLIHNNRDLSPVQKLHYLKSSLSGEPANLLSNLATTENNYDEAWNNLKRRYNNKRYNAKEILKLLFNQKSLSNESSTAIKLLLDTTSACLKSLNNLGINTDTWDTIVIYLVVSKLDYDSKKAWETAVSHFDADVLPSWEQLVTFLENRFRALEMVDETKSTRYIQPVKDKQSIKQRSFHSMLEEEKKDNVKVNCTFCPSQHLLYQCKQFGSKSPQERTEFVQSKGLCYNCLSSKHTVRFCHQPTSCRRCGRRHHSLLHYERGVNTEVTSSANTTGPKLASSQETGRNVVAHFTTGENQSEVLLATAIVQVNSQNGYKQNIRALVDQGSEASFVTENIVQALGLKKVPVNAIISGVGQGQSRTKSMVTFNLVSRHDSNFNVKVNAFVLRSLTSFIPSNKISIFDWPEIDNLPLADPKYGSPGKIDVILGVDVHSDILMEGMIKHPLQSGPIAQNTKLGWVLSGRVAEQHVHHPKIITLHLQVSEDKLLQKFWEIEREPDCIGKRLTKDEVKCEEIYEKTTVRNEEGRYVVKLPFKEEHPRCVDGRSKEIALKRFNYLEKKLKRNPSLQEEYTRVVEDYIEQGHLRKIENVEEIEHRKAVYLPHHAIIREDKETTKVRMVFDASCKGVNNVSLNDTLLIGPKLQQDLRHILMRWRTHRYCLVADLKQMYRQVLVHETDADFQRMLWRPSSDQPIQHYKLLRLTFGTACAPYLAVKSLHQLAKDEQPRFPLAAKITLRDYYMDDLLTGCGNENEATEIYDQMNKLMKSGGFELQKWCSNSKVLLNYIEKKNQSSKQSYTFKTDNMIKVLGIAWNKLTDNFEYTYNLPNTVETISKRKVLSDIARLYDPMGWIAPVIIVAKVFIQKLWKSGLAWDDNLTSDLLREWLCFRNQLSTVNRIVIPRWLYTQNVGLSELHVFVDASKKAYAAAVYLKCKNEIGVHVSLLTAKTKVAPIDKELSIPRMELCAALLGAKLIFEVAQIMKIPKENLYAWSDSTVVLAWISGEPSRWTTFVSNRVSEILTILNSERWYHVRTDHNPADCASRGATIADLTNFNLWWNGPDFLKQQDEYSSEYTFSTNEEERPIKSLAAVVQIQEDFIWNRFSNLPKLLRVLAYCRKFLELKVPREHRSFNKVITVQEMDLILTICVKKTQELYFECELEQLKSRGQVSKSSPLHTLAPFVDSNGVLRVGGRTNQGTESFNKKNPIIIPRDSHITKLLVLDAHIKTLHGGPQLMMSFLRAKFWIIRARECVKRCYRNCTICIRYSRSNNQQFMGQLPSVRLTPNKPFRCSGVDFTGHIRVRFSPGRGSKSYKGYVCLFICMVTKAIHLEAVSDLTSSGFIAAFRRFVSRRGACQHLYSDNGTNFVGAEKELTEMHMKAKSQLPTELVHLLANEGTTWHFIPPHAPNFGGLWEAGVRSTKSHLKRVIGEATLTFEELSTVLAQVEACLNSRPLSYLSDDPNDPLPLTPGHFLVGEPLVTIPDAQYSEADKISGQQRWRLVQKMTNDFWRKWSNEYLVNLNQRYKWLTKKSEPELNDIVIIKDFNIPPAKWLLGKIVDTHPGIDGFTRVVTVKTKNGICKRPCNKLCMLLKSEDG